MKHDRFSQILLFIAGLLLILNSVFALEQSLIIIIISITLFILGLLTLVIALILFCKNKLCHPKQC
ncbi:Uncharacterised protein [Staphylococcus nepalensis]|uniref:Uncharacterized protein n=1 Tax=Staphylococcus nepalensis TaxID=214473 RepID=A0A380GQB0_9STAP|nr:Uncharacterised protein [Staphylococcus nepalensis]VDG67753.1 Uncharacterised protein [Lacrimispora indolis]